METFEHSEAYERRWIIVVVVLIGTWVGTLGNSMIPVALPTIVDHYDVGLDLGVWVISIYTLLIAVLMPIYGWIGDRYGYQRLYSGSLFFLAFAFASGALAPTFPLLIGARVLQAIFNAVTLPAVMGIISAVFPKSERGAAMGVWATFNGAAHGFGPIISGFLVDHVDWTAIFWMNGATSLLGAILVYSLVPTDHKETRRPFDLVGAATLTGAMLTLMFVLSRGSSIGWTSPLIVGLSIAFVGLLVTFLQTEKRVEKPFVNLNLLGNRSYIRVVGVASLQFFCLMGLPVLLAIFLIEVHDYSSSTAGLLIAPLAATLAIASPAAGRLADQVGFRTSMLVGMVITAIMAITMAFWSETVQPLVIVPTLIICGMGMALTHAPAAAGITLVVSAEELGVALGIYHMFRFISGTFSVTTFGIILEYAEQNGLDQLRAIHLGVYLVIFMAFSGVVLATSIPRPKRSQESVVAASHS